MAIGSYVEFKFPLGTENAVFSLSCSSNGIDQYADAASSVIQTSIHPFYQLWLTVKGMYLF